MVQPPLPAGTKLKTLTTTVAACLLLLFTGALPRWSTRAQKPEAPTPNAASQSPLVIRVGAIYYDDSDESYHRMRSLLSRLETNDGTARRITFKLGVGTYDEVYHWFKSDQIDLAVMNPGPLALLLKEFGPKQFDKAFVGTRGVSPSDTSVAAANSVSARDKYNSIMVVNRDAIKKKFPSLSDKQTVSGDEAKPILDMVLNGARQHQAHFLFVHPFSTSGYIFPRKFLKEKGVDLQANDYELTYSHDVSIREIIASAFEGDRLKVAFVSDETKNTNTNNKLLIIRSDDLNTPIVQDALVFTPEFAQREPGELERVKDLLKSIAGQQTFNLTTPETWRKSYGKEWWESYEEIGKWIESFNGNDALMSMELTIDQIIRRINNYNDHHRGKPARVALVLSGGGAKCAYQLGAVEVIEDKLKAAQAKNNDSKPGIDLVVGTSGGAINALTIAAEVTKEEPGRRALQTTWENFGQSEILKPSNFVRRLLGFTLGFIFSLLAINAAYNRQLRRSALGIRDLEPRQNGKPTWFRKLRNRYRALPWFERLGIVMLGLALALYILGTKQIVLTGWLPAGPLLKGHVLVHIVEYGRQIVRWASLSIFIFGLLLTVDRSLASRQRAYATLSRRLLIPAVAIAVVLFFILPVATIYTTLQLQNTLFVSSGIDEKMAVEMPKLLSCDAGSGSLSERLEKISKEIIDNDLIKRDLVITGSVLSGGSSSKQSDATRQAADETDLYFIYTAGKSELPESLRKDNRFVSLKDPDNASILLDAVIGSGSIFPAFEPKRLTNIKRVMDKDALKDVAIIDGGFVHNSPIEAAVKLEATHIIMIEASPEYPPSTKVNLLSNSIAAFNHLFTQAQLLDARSRRQAEIFTLRPHQEPFLCTVDFGKNYIIEAMLYGRNDVNDTSTPRFVRQPRPSGL